MDTWGIWEEWYENVEEQRKLLKVQITCWRLDIIKVMWQIISNADLYRKVESKNPIAGVETLSKLFQPYKVIMAK